MGHSVPSLVANTTPIGVSNSYGRELSTFWPRVWALFVDLLIIGVTMALIWWVIGPSIDKAGPKGVFLKLALALPYFSILNSRIGDGQTIGKRWMDIQVVDESGATVSFARSFLRSLVFLVPYYLGLDFPETVKLSQPVRATVQLLTLVASATVYLVMFNRRNRQGIHDLVAKTCVVDHGAPIPPAKSPTWKPHWLIFAAIVIADFLFNKLLP